MAKKKAESKVVGMTEEKQVVRTFWHPEYGNIEGENAMDAAKKAKSKSKKTKTT